MVLSDPTGLSSWSAPGAGVPHMGLQCFPNAPLPISCQLHWSQESLGTKMWGQPFPLRSSTSHLAHSVLQAVLTAFCMLSLAP